MRESHPDVPPLPEEYREEFSRLSVHIREHEMNPPFRVGDVVYPSIALQMAHPNDRREGVVRRFVWWGCHLCAEVDFGGPRLQRSPHHNYSRERWNPFLRPKKDVAP